MVLKGQKNQRNIKLKKQYITPPKKHYTSYTKYTCNCKIVDLHELRRSKAIKIISIVCAQSEIKLKYMNNTCISGSEQTTTGGYKTVRWTKHCTAEFRM